MNYLVCACAIGCAAIFCSVGMLMASAADTGSVPASGYAIGAEQ